MYDSSVTLLIDHWSLSVVGGVSGFVVVVAAGFVVVAAGFVVVGVAAVVVVCASPSTVTVIPFVSRPP